MFELFMNELSFRNPAGDHLALTESKAAAVSLLNDLICAVREGERLSLAKAFRMDPDLLLAQLCNGYSLTDWLYDPSVDRDSRLFIKRRAAMLPILRPQTLEVLVGGKIAIGIGAAHLEKGLALSVPSSRTWMTMSVAALLVELTETGVLTEVEIVVSQISAQDQWSEHYAREQKQLLVDIRNGRQLTEVSAMAFRHLEICHSASKQISTLTGSERYFDWLKESLRKADAAAAAWEYGEFPHRDLPGPATGESGPVHDNERLIKMRHFVCFDGQSRLHEHHMKNHADNIRIYYRFDAPTRRISVGYVGSHLETVRY